MMTMGTFGILESLEKGNKVGRREQLVKFFNSGTLESLLKRKKYSKTKNPSKAGKC